MENKPKLLLHSCCAPCSSGVIDQVFNDFDVTIFFYNPNIYPESEFVKRAEEQVKFLTAIKDDMKVDYIICDYLGQDYENAVKGFEQEKEGGSRCEICYRLRMRKTCEYAKTHGFDFFTTTLSVSPYKNAEKLNKIGFEIESEVGGVKYLSSNFKKHNGYLNSINNSKKYNLYRQNYCGCKYSLPNNQKSE